MKEENDDWRYEEGECGYEMEVTHVEKCARRLVRLQRALV